MTKDNLNWTGFYKKSLEERLQLIEEQELLGQDDFTTLQQDKLLPLSTANQMTENVLGRLALPFSLAPDF